MMFKEIIELLDRNRSDLVTKIDVDHGLLDRLAAKHVLEAGHVKEIKSKKNMKIRNECLLDILKQRDSRCYEDFRKELSVEQEDLVDDYLPYFETDTKKRKCEFDDDISKNAINKKRNVSSDSGAGANSAVSASISIQDAIRSCHDKLLQIMDVDNGMTGRLIEKDLITSEEYDEICDQDNYMEQNETLLNKMYSRMSTRSTELFMKILLDTKQEHVANYIKNSAGVTKANFGDIYPLADVDIKKINYNMFCLTKLIDPYKMELVFRLISDSCFSDRHLDRILAYRDKERQSRELMTVMKRRSIANYKRFRISLRDTLQEDAAEILNSGGDVFQVKVRINTNDQETTEKQLVKMLCGSERIGSLTLGEEKNAKIEKILKDLERSDIKLVGATWKDSILLFMLCENLDALKTVKTLLESGDLKSRLEEYLNCLPGVENSFTIEVSIDEEEYDKCSQQIQLQAALTSEQMCTVKPPSIDHVISIESLPPVMVDRIMVETAFKLWIHQSGRDSQNSMLQSSSSISDILPRWLSAGLIDIYASLASACSPWRHFLRKRKHFRTRLLNKIFMHLMHRSRSMLVGRLDLHHGLIPRMLESRILTKDVANSLNYDGSQTSNHRHEQIDGCKKLWHHVCIDCCNFTRFSLFLRFLEETCQRHLVNYMISHGVYHFCFQDVWPIDENLRMQIQSNRDLLSELMNPKMLVVSRKEDQIENEFEERLLIGDKKSTESVDLFSRLFSKGLITNDHLSELDEREQMIEKNKVLLQLLSIGSIETYKAAIGYFKETNQTQVVDILQTPSINT